MTAVVRRGCEGFQRQVSAARASRPSGHILRDSRGRRLRASAYQGPRRRSARRGGDLGRTGSARWIGGVARVAVVAVVVMAAFLGTSQGYISYAADLPDAHQLTAAPLPADTIIYAADGSVMADLRPPTGEHYQQALEQMGSYLPEATIAIEDAGFYSQPGIDPKGIVRAAIADVESSSTEQGASTITQQLAKLELQNGFDGTVRKKIKNIILAVQIEHTYSKQQILGMYLNAVDYGNNAIGAEAAAQNYFRLNTNQLDLAQASMLAGIPRNPNYYDPQLHPNSAKARQLQVLQAMVKQRMVTEQQAKAAYTEPLSYQSETPTFDQNPDYVIYAVEEMELQFNLTQTEVEGGGYRVYTPYNPTINAIAQANVTSEAERSAYLNIQQGAMTALDPKTGGIVAMVGSAWAYDSGKYNSQYNWALAPRHPGSSFKILNYTAALTSKAFTMSTPIPDGPASYAPDPSWHLTNYETGSYPPCFVAQCWASSENIPAVFVELAQPGGTASVVNTARNMGLNVWDSSCNQPGTAVPYPGWPSCNGQNFYQDNNSALFDNNRAPNTFGPSLTVGGYDETTIDMAQAAQVEADGGVLHPATAIEKIINADGSTFYQWNPPATGKQVVSPQVAWLVNTILSTASYKELGFGSTTENLVVNGWRAAAKTGTAENWTDSWTIGWQPSLVSAFWFGNLNENIGTGGEDAVLIASPCWKSFMQQALAAMNVPQSQWYLEPTGLFQQGTNSLGLPNYYLAGTGPSTPTPAMPAGLSVNSGSQPHPATRPGGKPSA
jgi:membrane peptidoglycan carboxypeptidase